MVTANTTPLLPEGTTVRHLADRDEYEFTTAAGTTNTVTAQGFRRIFNIYEPGIFTTTNATTTWTMTNDQIFTGWIQQATTAITTAAWDVDCKCTAGTANNYHAHFVNNAVWTQWNETHTEIQTLIQETQAIRRYSRRQMTEAELKAELLKEKAWQEQERLRVAKQEQALAKAEKLLRSCLTPQQAEDLEKKGRFYVEIPRDDGKLERYRIDRGTHGNVHQLDAKGSIIRSFCIQPNGVPVPDSMLTQKLWLEASDESRAKFFETANITPVKAEAAIPVHIPRHERYKYGLEHGLLH